MDPQPRREAPSLDLGRSTIRADQAQARATALVQCEGQHRRAELGLGDHVDAQIREGPKRRRARWPQWQVGEDRAMSNEDEIQALKAELERLRRQAEAGQGEAADANGARQREIIARLADLGVQLG